MYAFVDGHSDMKTRLREAWFARLFVDGWRAWLLANPSEEYTGKDKAPTPTQLLKAFITPNAYACVVLNAENLLLYLHWLRSLPADVRAGVPLAPWLLGSQQNEVCFVLLSLCMRANKYVCARLLQQCFRAMRQHRTRTETFNTLDAQNRLSAIQHHAVIVAKNSTGLWWRPHHKHKSVESLHRPALPAADITEQELRDVLQLAFTDARTLLIKLGMYLPEPEVQLTPADLEIDEEELEVDDDELTGASVIEPDGIWADALLDMEFFDEEEREVPFTNTFPTLHHDQAHT